MYETRTGPYAVRADIPDEVSHDANNSFFFTFSAHTKMAADKRGQIEVFARKHTTYLSMVIWWMVYILLFCPHLWNEFQYVFPLNHRFSYVNGGFPMFL